MTYPNDDNARPLAVPIHFPLLPDEEGWPPVPSETLWGRPTRDGHYQVITAPFFAHEVHRNDLVAAVPLAPEGLEFLKVLRPSEHRTVLLGVKRPAAFTPIVNRLVGLGCQMGGSVLEDGHTVDVPPEVEASQVAALLNEAASRDILLWWQDGQEQDIIEAARALATAREASEYHCLGGETVCPLCQLELAETVGCRWDCLSLEGDECGDHYQRIPYGEEDFDEESPTQPGDVCPCCQASPGYFHHPNCCQEQCPVCHEQLFRCPCQIEAWGLLAWEERGQ